LSRAGAAEYLFISAIVVASVDMALATRQTVGFKKATESSLCDEEQA